MGCGVGFLVGRFVGVGVAKLLLLHRPFVPQKLEQHDVSSRPVLKHTCSFTLQLLFEDEDDGVVGILVGRVVGTGVVEVVEAELFFIFGCVS